MKTTKLLLTDINDSQNQHEYALGEVTRTDMTKAYGKGVYLYDKAGFAFPGAGVNLQSLPVGDYYVGLKTTTGNVTSSTISTYVTLSDQTKSTKVAGFEYTIT